MPPGTGLLRGGCVTLFRLSVIAELVAGPQDPSCEQIEVGFLLHGDIVMPDGRTEGPDLSVGAGPDTDLLLHFRVLVLAPDAEDGGPLEGPGMVKLSLGRDPGCWKAFHDRMGRVLIVNPDGKMAPMTPGFDPNELVPFLGTGIPECVHRAMDHDDSNAVVDVGLDDFFDHLWIFELGMAFVVDDHVVGLGPIGIFVNLRQPTSLGILQ